MLLSNVLLGSALTARDSWCGNEKPSPEFLATLSSLQAIERNSPLVYSRQNSSTNATINIPVHIHGIVNTTDSDDTLSDAVLQAQFDVLVDRYAPYDITFSLQNKTRLIDDNAAKGFDYSGWNSFKLQNRKGDYTALNLYYVTNMDDTFWSLGVCSLPSNPIDSIFAGLDGCTINAGTTPGGSWKGRSYKGEITIHEVGHWLSLLHTYDGMNCAGPGDYIDDTAAEAALDVNVCPVGRDSCPDQPGLDPVDNYMDTAGEECWNKFTEGQRVRMHSAWWNLRVPQGHNATTVVKRT
ncbi:hypothetical protein GQ53DRAFT_840915 [Thozetella sp. PMI_491]|nr:hypothetical protein GQ53DRAFT_840915 [Thozetella sp. PMI_491]